MIKGLLIFAVYMDMSSIMHSVVTTGTVGPLTVTPLLGIKITDLSPHNYEHCCNRQRIRKASYVYTA